MLCLKNGWDIRLTFLICYFYFSKNMTRNKNYQGKRNRSFTPLLSLLKLVELHDAAAAGSQTSVAICPNPWNQSLNSAVVCFVIIALNMVFLTKRSLNLADNFTPPAFLLRSTIIRSSTTKQSVLGTSKTSVTVSITNPLEPYR
mmetsp:Transcript_4289/g.6219  ORF Transcript_4289/g.6219 Transcript_4289/m.6219 type:complete len:144 (-) Transcript_4289:607-1038(-)